MANPKWHSADFSKLVPDEINTIVSTTQSILTPAAAVLDVLASTLNTVSTFLLGLALDIIQPVIDLLDEIKDTFFGTGFYYLDVWDHALGQVQKEIAYRNANGEFKSYAVTFPEFLRTMSRTLDDDGDEDKPTFGSTTSAFVLVVAASSPEDFISVFNSIASLFPTDREIQRIKSLLADALNETTSTSFAKPYDWQNATNKDFLTEFVPPLAELIDNTFEQVVSILAAGQNAAKGIAELVDVVNQKVIKLNSLVQELTDLITNLNNILSATGIHILFIDSVSGVAGVKQALTKSEDQPFNTGVYISGGMWLVGPAGAATFKVLLENV